MFKGCGKSVFPGVAVGPIFELKTGDTLPVQAEVLDEASEKKRFLSAKETASSQIDILYNKVMNETGADEAAIMDVQTMILQDGDFNDAVLEGIRNGLGAEGAVAAAGKKFSDFFSSLDDPYMKSRASDVEDLAGRLSAILSGRETAPVLTEPSILVCDDLTPSETAALDKSMILALVLRHGSINSHAAILARAMNIPSLIQANLPLETLEGRIMAVDGFTGEFFLDPSETISSQIGEKGRTMDLKRRSLEKVRGLPSVTLSGRKVRIYANIRSPEDVLSALREDAEGVGLFRSEFLFLGRDNWPTEDEQFEAYRQVAQGMEGRPVIIRTMDIGADKKVSYLDQGPEENPAMGFRAIRIGLDKPELLKTQLRAIYRASPYGSVAVMFPMIVSADETRKALELADQAMSEVISRGIKAKPIRRGIMIETPAAVMISSDLAKLVDFFSVGTNDLTQYTLAMDRQNQRLEGFYDPHHPAILEMLRITVQNAHAAGIWAGICGELAADPELTDMFLEMGYDELSVSPPFILELRKRVRESRI